MIFSSKQGLRRLWWHARQSVNNDNRKNSSGAHTAANNRTESTGRAREYRRSKQRAQAM